MPEASPSDKFAWHEELRVFEANRRQKYSSKLDSSRLYWKAYTHLLEDGKLETERAHRILLGVAQAQKVLATSLRSKKYVRKTKKKQDVGFLDTLNESTDEFKATFTESSRYLISLDAKLSKLLQQSMDGIMHLEGRGKSILDLMEQTQNQTVEAWETYFNSLKSSEVASYNPSLLAPIGPQHQEASPISSSTSDKKSDKWLAEITYRSCVQRQLETWETALEQLSKLFTAARMVECRRRMNLREFLVAFWKQQHETLNQSENIHTKPLMDWVDKVTSKEDVEKDMKQSIEKLARAVQGLEDLADDSLHTHFNNAFAEQDHKDTSDVQPLEDRLSVLGFYEELFTTGLDSDYIIHATIVEVARKTDLLRSKYALCVVTLDEAVHLFHLKNRSQSPRDAIALILDRRSHEKEYSLQPDESIQLDLVEVVDNLHASKIDLSPKPSARPQVHLVSLISATLEEHSALMAALRERKGGAK